MIRTDPLVHHRAGKHQKTYSTPTERKLTQGEILKRSPFFSAPKPFDKMPPVPKGWGYLPIKTTIIVPSTNKQQKFIGDAELDKRVEETQKFMSIHFGGYTDIKAEGGYVSDKSGKVLKDKTVSVVGFASAETFLKHRNKLKEWMMNKVSEWGQETLGFEFEDDLYYIQGKK